MYFLDCWHNEPDNRPTISQVASKLNAIIQENNKDFMSNNSDRSTQSSKQQINLNSFEDIKNNLPHGELFKVIQEFNKMNTEEVESSMPSNNNFKMIIDEIVELLNKIVEEEEEER